MPIDNNAYNAYNDFKIKNEGADMAVLNIRNLPEDVHAKLRIRAAKAGRSMEAEAREILARACLTEPSTLPSENLQDWVDNLYAGRKPKGVVDDLIAERRRDSRNE